MTRYECYVTLNSRRRRFVLVHSTGDDRLNFCGLALNSATLYRNRDPAETYKGGRVAIFRAALNGGEADLESNGSDYYYHDTAVTSTDNNFFSKVEADIFPALRVQIWENYGYGRGEGSDRGAQIIGRCSTCHWMARGGRRKPGPQGGAGRPLRPPKKMIPDWEWTPSLYRAKQRELISKMDPCCVEETRMYIKEEWVRPASLPTLNEWIGSGVWMRGKAGTGDPTEIAVEGKRKKTRRYKGVDAALKSDQQLYHELLTLTSEKMQQSERGKVRPRWCDSSIIS
ncbi:unnamed protein product [Spodoptera exigua]|nr:unnamed protein product [Spodoptera exigua]